MINFKPTSSWFKIESGYMNSPIKDITELLIKYSKRKSLNNLLKVNKYWYTHLSKLVFNKNKGKADTSRQEKELSNIFSGKYQTWKDKETYCSEGILDISNRKQGLWKEVVDGCLYNIGCYVDNEKHGDWSKWKFISREDGLFHLCKGSYINGLREGLWQITFNKRDTKLVEYKSCCRRNLTLRFCRAYTWFRYV